MLESLVLVEERPAAHARHHQVENDDVWACRANEVETLGTIARLADAIPFAEKQITQQAAQRGLVDDDQYELLRAGASFNVVRRCSCQRFPPTTSSPVHFAMS